MDQYKFIILRLNENTQAFDSIGTTSLNTYTDNQLQNQKLYCYKIKAYGTYGILSIEQPLLNHSNEQCAVPEDKNLLVALFLMLQDLAIKNYIKKRFLTN